MKPYEFIVVFLLGGVIAAVAIAMSWDNPYKTQMPPISDRGRWDDLNNAAARNRFCQSVGYESGRLSENVGVGQVRVTDIAGNPYGYDIECFGSVPKQQTFDYDVYKRWMLSIEINGGNRT